MRGIQVQKALLSAVLPLAVVVALGGCDDTGNAPALTLAEHACIHMQEAAGIMFTAGQDPATPPATEPEDWDHQRVRVDLVALAGGGQGGFVAFEASTGGDVHFFLSDDLPFAVLDATDLTDCTIEESDAVAECAEIAVVHVVEIQEGKECVLNLGGVNTALTQVGIVVESADHNH